MRALEAALCIVAVAVLSSCDACSTRSMCKKYDDDENLCMRTAGCRARFSCKPEVRGACDGCRENDWEIGRTVCAPLYPRCLALRESDGRKAADIVIPKGAKARCVIDEGDPLTLCTLKVDELPTGELAVSCRDTLAANPCRRCRRVFEECGGTRKGGSF